MLNEQQNKLIDALPPVLQRIKDLERICEIEQPFFDAAWQAVDRSLQEQFVLACGEYGLSRWEKLLGISCRADADTNERLRAILFRLNEQLPFTYTKLKSLLALVSPEGEYSIELDREQMRLAVNVSLYCKPVERLIIAVLEKTLPANILWELVWSYNYYRQVAVYTHGALAEKTHYEIREEVLQ